MAHRIFVDRVGRKWDAWTVFPTSTERRSNAEPVAEDRRRNVEPRIRLGHAMANGWLCFETAGEKRRLAPFPEAWDMMSDDELANLCDEADKASSPRRLLD